MPVDGSVVYSKSDTQHQSYRDPAGGTESSIGPQIRTDYYSKKALIELKKEQYFSQLADTTSMPKHMGKTIKKYHYLPLLDDRNANDQGIDAAGAVTLADTFWVITGPTVIGGAATVLGHLADVDETGDPATGPITTDVQAVAEFNRRNPDGVYLHGEMAVADAAVNDVAGAGNLYGSSKDIGTIVGKMPALSEHGGRVNRVGFKRIELEGTLEKFGYFDEYTQESLDFDTDSELMMHINREMLRGANEITEDALQVDLLNSAGVSRYSGAAVNDTEVLVANAVDYSDLQKLAKDLDDNRAPKNTKIITGSRMIDTRTIDGARYMYVSSDLTIQLQDMLDNHGNPAFVPTHQYGAATTLATGEVGSICKFRIIEVPEMAHWAGAGGTAEAEALSTGAGNDIYPMLVVGSGSFTTVGFQTDGKTVKFKIIHKKPGKDIADRDDPYGEIGFMSIKWYYGFMLQRPEWIAVIKTVALA